MKFKSVFYFVITLMVVMSCSKDKIANEQTAFEHGNQLESGDDIRLNGSNWNYSTFGEQEIDSTYALQVANEGMIDFVEGISGFYEPGMSYSDLKHAMNPENNLANISEAGNDLLNKAYYHIVNKTPKAEMSGYELMKAIEYVAQVNVERGNGNTIVADSIMVKTMKEDLFGIAADYELPGYETMGDGCGFFCSIWNGLKDAWNWLTGDGPDDDTDPRYVEILRTAKDVISIIGALW